MTEKRRYRFTATPAEFEVRSKDDGSVEFTGYAAVFNSESDKLSDFFGDGFVEVVRPGAFRRTLKDKRNKRLLVDHNPEKMLASTGAGSLRLAEDDRGLLSEGTFAPTSYAADLAVLMERKEVNSMSFEFSPTEKGEKWNPDLTYRELTDLRLYEVSILTGNDPAYPATSVSLRRLARAIEADEELLADAMAALETNQPLTDDQFAVISAAAETLRANKPAEPEIEPEESIPMENLLMIAELQSKELLPLS